jgi:hypothetical protein
MVTVTDELVASARFGPAQKSEADINQDTIGQERRRLRCANS